MRGDRGPGRLGKLTRVNLGENNRNFTSERCASRLSIRGFPGGAVVENLPANAGRTGSSPGLGRSHMPRSN